MAKVMPFKAIRPREDMASTIAALPYDVYNRAEATEAVRKHPDSFLAIDRAETGFGPEVDTYADEVYARANELLQQWIEEGRFIQDEKPCYYVYELVMDGRSQTGIVACASVADYESGVIKKHENTRAEKEADRIRHVDTCNAQTGPIFLAYRSNELLSSIVKRTKESAPMYDFVAEDGIAHRCWIIDGDSDIRDIKAAFENINAIYIADGHHRAASAVRVGQKRREAAEELYNYFGDEQYNFFLSVLFPDDELKIYDYNRVVKDIGGLTHKEIVDTMGVLFDVIETSKSPIRPREKGQFSMFIDDTWTLYAIQEQDKVDDPVQGLDVSLLQELVLEPFYGISDPKTDDRIDFVGGIRGLEELERRVHTDCEVAFAMYPTDISELFEVADADLLMPPKSTWFEPKLRSGLFIHRI